MILRNRCPAFCRHYRIIVRKCRRHIPWFFRFYEKGFQHAVGIIVLTTHPTIPTQPWNFSAMQTRMKNVTANQFFALKWCKTQSELVKFPWILRKYQQWPPKSPQAVRKCTTNFELLQAKTPQSKTSLVFFNIWALLDFYRAHFWISLLNWRYDCLKVAYIYKTLTPLNNSAGAIIMNSLYKFSKSSSYAGVGM